MYVYWLCTFLQSLELREARRPNNMIFSNNGNSAVLHYLVNAVLLDYVQIASAGFRYLLIRPYGSEGNIVFLIHLLEWHMTSTSILRAGFVWSEWGVSRLSDGSKLSWPSGIKCAAEWVSLGPSAPTLLRTA